MLATLLALLTFAAFAFVIWERHHLAQFNRTHEQPLEIDPDNPVLSSAHQLLRTMKPASSDNNLRFAAMPSFGERWFAISLVKNGGKGVGQAVIMRPEGSVISTRSFELSLRELEQFFDMWDDITDSYSGESRSFTDGTTIAFERQRGPKFTSGVGNSPCHYDVLGDWAAQRLSSFVPELSDLRSPIAAQMLKTDSCNDSIFVIR